MAEFSNDPEELMREIVDALTRGPESIGAQIRKHIVEHGHTFRSLTEEQWAARDRCVSGVLLLLYTLRNREPEWRREADTIAQIVTSLYNSALVAEDELSRREIAALPETGEAA